MERILYNQAIVVYGKETMRYTPPGAPDPQLQNANFTVYCVLKNDDSSQPIPENIIVEEVSPVHSCSGTKITLQTDVILGLRRKESTGNFLWDEPNVTPDGAAFDYTPEVLVRATSVCGVQEPAVPQGRDANAMPTCPQISASQKEQCVSSAYRATVQGLVVLMLSMASYLSITTDFH